MSTKLANRIKQVENELAAIDKRSGETMTHDDSIRADALTDELRSLEQIASEPLPRITQAMPVGDSASIRVKSRQLTCFSSERQALDFGKWVLGVSNPKYSAGMLEGNNSKGGFLVPDEFSRDMIRLVEERGVFRKEARVAQMSSDTLLIPRQIAGSTAYFVGEADAITDSDLTLDQITLTLKKAACLTSFSSELNSDSLIPVADMLATDFAYRLADKEDECGFNGDGTSTYGGITGVRQKLIDKALSGDETGAVPDASGLVRYGTGHAYGNITLGGLNELVGKLPTFAEAGAKWFMSKFVWSFILDLCCDAGGNSLETLQRGPTGRILLGYPVVISQVMPKASAANQVCVLLGDLRQAASMGVDRAGLRVEASDSAVVGGVSCFETDQIAIRGIERFDIVAHDCGSTTEAGPICGLISHTA